MDPTQVKIIIRYGISVADLATTALDHVRDLAGTGYHTAASTAHDSRHEHVQRGIGRLGQALREITLIHRRLDASRTAAARYIEVIA